MILNTDNLDYRIAHDLMNTDKIMNDTFWVGVYPGIDSLMLEYMKNEIIHAIQNICS